MVLRYCLDNINKINLLSDFDLIKNISKGTHVLIIGVFIEFLDENCTKIQLHVICHNHWGKFGDTLEYL